jgi:hypothetical protein
VETPRAPPGTPESAHSKTGPDPLLALCDGRLRSCGQATPALWSARHDNSVCLGLGVTTSPLVFKNQMRFNMIHDNTTGLYFREDAHNNDTTRNAFTGTATPVVDAGVGNVY